MCGRYNLITDAGSWIDAFGISAEGDGGSIARYNIAPGTAQPVVLVTEGARKLRSLHWGLIPHWSRDRSIAFKTTNARGETAATRPAFRAAFRHRRCLVPATGYYEWKTIAGKKQPYLIALAGGALFAMAGLWEAWQGPEGEVRSFSIVTTAPSELAATIHDRMPVILPRAQYDRWLDPNLTDSAQIQPLIASYPAGEMIAYPVSARLNNARNQGAELIERVRLGGEA